MRLSRVTPTAVAAALLLLAPLRGIGAQQLPMVGHSFLSTPASRFCPTGSVVTGLRARVGLYVDAIGLRCRPVRSDGTLGAETSAGSYSGGTGGTERIRSCPTGTVAVGQRIGLTAPAKPVRIGLFCRGWNASTRTTTGTSLLLDVVTSALSIQLTEDARCPSANAPIVGAGIYAEAIVDKLGFVCRVP